MVTPDLQTVRRMARQGNSIMLGRRLTSDQLTPVLAYRRLVSPDDRTAPSFLLESVESGATVGRYSFLGAQPAIEVVARGFMVTVTDHRRGTVVRTEEDNPLDVPRRLLDEWRPAPPADATGGGASPGFTGGWVGFVGYDTVRYLEPEKLSFAGAPSDDRGLPDLHFGLYRQVAIFDHVEKTLHAVCHVRLDEHDSIENAYRAGLQELDEYVERLETHSAPLPPGTISLDLAQPPTAPTAANFTRGDFEQAVRRGKAYIAAGDVFQVVLSQRFRRETAADPFDIYRALRIVNPSPYMIYLQAEGAILSASSPEILCRCQDDVVTSRPLAGTRRRGTSEADDLALESELRASEKERAEHVMLVDLARNDLGRVCRPASISLDRVMDVERYSHVMHLSSTVRGRLRPEMDCWDALRHALPVGTVSGAPKIRAMQIIDELEPTRRGPYAGGIGAIGFRGDMDIALALRTMVIPTAGWQGGAWTVHLQAGAGIVADSDPAAEFEETVSKAAALGRAIDLAESSFQSRD
ncbi:MAG: anthranilate synthase component I [Planctomycetota bacterium]|jgi:anthranilate synthase component 1